MCKSPTALLTTYQSTCPHKYQALARNLALALNDLSPTRTRRDAFHGMVKHRHLCWLLKTTM